MNTALPMALLIGALVGIATTGLAVWFYNRFLAPFAEFPPKKPGALLALPSGLPIGLLVAWRLCAESPGLLEHVLWFGLALAGGLIALRMIAASSSGRALARASHYRRVEDMPPALNWREFPLRQRFILRLLQPINQVGALRIHQREVHLPGLSSAFDGYRILHVTDPHVNPTLNTAWYEAAINAAMALKPDLALHGGDFITRPQFLPQAAELLSPLANAPDGAYAVRGNHDLWKAPQRACNAGRAAGLQMLSNEGITIRRGEACLSLIGLEVPYIGLAPHSQSLLRQLPGPRIALVHTPDAFRVASRLGCGLALAGHTHGGQIRLPLLGATVSSCAAGPRLATGLARLGSMLCITSNGLGSFFPLRILCPPEIIFIVLRASDSA